MRANSIEKLNYWITTNYIYFENNLTMLVILVGPKGSGKTTIGKVLAEAGTHIVFLEVEKIFLQVMHEYGSAVDNVFKKVHETIDAQILQLLSTHTTVIIESLGLGAPGKSMDTFLEHYKQLFNKVFLVRVQCPLEICLDRCKNRNKTDQVLLDLERIKSYNEQAAKVKLQWDLELTNCNSMGGGLSNEEILVECATIL